MRKASGAPMVKMIFFDIDGTLIEMGKKQMTARMEETLIRLKEKGILLCIATGRPLREVPCFKRVQFDAYLTFNGSYCRNQKEVIYANPIFPEDVDQVLENAAHRHRYVALATLHEMGANGKDSNLEEYFAHANQIIRVAKHFDQLRRQPVYQMMIACSPDKYGHFTSNTRNVTMTSWSVKAADVIPANGGKGAAVEKMLGYYGISPDEAMAFGDGKNDIELLRTVGMGIAMGNASDEVKRCAKAVCPSVDEDGIYHYCKQQKMI